MDLLRHGMGGGRKYIRVSRYPYREVDVDALVDQPGRSAERLVTNPIQNWWPNLHNMPTARDQADYAVVAR